MGRDGFDELKWVALEEGGKYNVLHNAGINVWTGRVDWRHKGPLTLCDSVISHN